MGFPALWRKWISGILSSSRSSILVNGAPSHEFNIERGVRQGDPLSPLLFILAMEALHVATVTANAQGIFKGCKMPNSGPTISHLLYVDDVLFIGEWTDSNFRNLSRLLRCFNLSSGLKVNFDKSNLFGVGVPTESISEKASILRCKTGVFPFTYLGLPLGANMGLVKNWKPIIDRFEAKLTAWKARTLSFGDRLTLIEAVLVVAPKEKGGLGFASLAATNKALMIKWLICFKNEPSSLWARLISVIHAGGRCHSFIPLKSSIGGVWKSLINLGRISQNQPLNVQERMVLRMGNGKKALFWLDIWAGDRPLRDLFPNLYDLESEKRCYVSDRYNINQGSIVWYWGSNNSLSSANQTEVWAECILLMQKVDIQMRPDVWLWKSGSEAADYTVSSVRAELDHIDTINETRVLKWLHLIPKKVNCFYGGWYLIE
ncbi:uncharacterized protein LOC110876737 [Helianthus annuus]|uniref:uncharacterized protein LOC110876737 n=1 Tax=Helianthus annuus TaxID=4232 RepID=UPI000B8F270C|nr:uncharacterized protein LOC110876737 [Helianthus annuus]